MSAKTRVCIISPEIVGPHKNGGVGTHCFHFSAFLAQQLGQEVTFLYTGEINVQNEAYWKDWFRRELQVDFVWLPPVGQSSVPGELFSGYARLAGQVYEWLRAKPFDACHFQEMLGNGFRCFQAKRLGLAFQKTTLTCMVHSSCEWISQAMQALPQGGAEELRAKYLERYSIEHSDLLISPSRYMLRWLEQEQIKIPRQNYVLPYLSDPNLKPVGCRPPAGHLIFFGRLEVRKGLLLFLETLLELDRQQAFKKIKVTFLGKPGYTPDGNGLKTIRRFQTRFSPAMELITETELGQPEALKLLTTNNDALIVCPSLIDNSPFAIIESLQLGLNIIAANSGGIPELFASPERLFEPELGALSAKIKAGLNNELPPPAKSWELEENTKLWRQFCEQTVPAFVSQSPGRARSTLPGVKVFFSPGTSAPANLRALESLRAQTWKPLSVTVVLRGNGQISPPSAHGLQDVCRQHGWDLATRFGVPASAGQTPALSCAPDNSATFTSSDTPPAEAGTPNVEHSPASVGLAELLPEPGARVHYAIFLNGAAFNEPQAIARLVEALEWSGLDGLTCWAQIQDEEHPQRSFFYEPFGSFLEGGMFTNLFGAGCVMLKLDAQRTNLPCLERLLRPAAAWGYLAEAASRGEQWDVLPEKLISLPRREAALSCSDLDYAGQMEVLRGYGKSFPMWFHHFLVDTVTAQAPRLRAEQNRFHRTNEMRALSSWTPKKILYKIKRETRRLLNQLLPPDTDR